MKDKGLTRKGSSEAEKSADLWCVNFSLSKALRVKLWRMGWRQGQQEAQRQISHITGNNMDAPQNKHFIGLWCLKYFLVAQRQSPTINKRYFVPNVFVCWNSFCSGHLHLRSGSLN